MSALENCWVIVGCGSGAHFSVLSGKRHQGRTARRAGEPLYRTALGGRCRLKYTALPLHSPIIPPSAEWVALKRTVGEWVSKLTFRRWASWSAVGRDSSCICTHGHSGAPLLWHDAAARTPQMPFRIHLTVTGALRRNTPIASQAFRVYYTICKSQVTHISRIFNGVEGPRSYCKATASKPLKG
jgi:hypothetical protein